MTAPSLFQVWMFVGYPAVMFFCGYMTCRSRRR